MCGKNLHIVGLNPKTNIVFDLKIILNSDSDNLL